MPNIQHLGTDYGGWSVDLDYIQDGDIIIDAGLGEDISFPIGLQGHKKVHVVGIDPTAKSIKYVKEKAPENFELLEYAIAADGTETVTMHKNTNPNWVSESTFASHASVGDETYEAKCISFKKLREKYDNISVIKMDIEGEEYSCLEECIGVKQICVEFHHMCMDDKTQADTESLINKMKENGYAILKSNARRTEITFLKV